MAKKGGVQQLQAELNTDDDFFAFIGKDIGLLVMDIYTEWCGPCVGIVSSLKKIKLELGGDNLHLAVCKSDTINALKRFRNKSEPTWLFASHGKIVNLMFGTNVPKLMKMITEELDLDAKYRAGQAERIFYEMGELLPEEIERLEIKQKVEEEIAKAEVEEAKRQKRAYYLGVTEQITQNIPDVGCTIFMPNVNRDIYKKLTDPAEKYNLTAKERKITNMTMEQREIFLVDCPNVLPEPVLDYILKKDVIINSWKLAEGETKAPETILKDFTAFISQRQAITDDAGNAVGDAFVEPLIEQFKLPGSDIVIPGAWTPDNKTTNAALIYLFFKQFTELFLPPDPLPEPPHLCCIYDAYKKREISELCVEYSKDVLAMGYFSTADPDNYELLATTTNKYNDRKPVPTDKLIIKLAKVSSNAVLAFQSFGPCYISQNTVDGFQECFKFFPKGYGQEDEDEGSEAGNGKKRRRKRRSKKGAAEGGEAVEEVGDDIEGEEGTSSSSGSPEKQAAELETKEGSVSRKASKV